MKSLVKVSLSICAGVIAFFVALPWIAYFIVMLATTSYSVEWLGRGHSDSWSLHTVLIDGAELRIRFYELHNGRYALEVYPSEAYTNFNGAATYIHVGKRSPEVHEATVRLHQEFKWYRAILSEDFTPRQEGESLELKFSIPNADAPMGTKEFELRFESKRVRHYLNIFTDIT